MQFSPALIERCIRYFKERHNTIITPERAAAFLQSLSEVYLTCARIQAVQAHEQDGGKDPLEAAGA